MGCLSWSDGGYAPSAEAMCRSPLPSCDSRPLQGGEPRRSVSRPRFMRVLPGLLLCTVLAGCSGDAPSADTAEEPVASPTTSETRRATTEPFRTAYVALPDPGSPMMGALLTGSLHADPATGCLWVAEGSREVQVRVYASEDTRTDFSQDLAVIRRGTETVAREGDPVTLTGGYVGDNGLGVPGCPAEGEVFLGGLRAAP